MSGRNRERKNANRDARTAADMARSRTTMHRTWAVAATAAFVLPACAFAIAKATQDPPARVMVADDAASSLTVSSFTVPPTDPINIRVAAPAPGVATKSPTAAGQQAITRTRYVQVPVPVSSAQSGQPTPGVQVVPGQGSAARGSTTTTTVPPSKPCVRSTQSLPSGGTVPVAVGPAPTRLVVRDLVVGTGATVKPHSMVTVEYTAVACSTGKIVDTSILHGGSTTLDLDNVIVGWQLGLPGTKIGGTRLLGVPASMAYGIAGRPPIIGPNEALWFQVKVLQTDVTIGPPGAVEHLTATPAIGAADLAWVKPAENGATVNRYQITTYEGTTAVGTQTIYTTQDRATISGLTGGTTYRFKIAARNDNGLGPASDFSNQIVLTSVNETTTTG